MEHHVVLGVSSIVVLGVVAQWLAGRLRLPSILTLLVSGFVLGPLLGWLRPDELIGDVLPTLVSLAVAIILFDGGLSLRFSEIREIGGVVPRLITVGVLVTALVGAAASFLLLPFGPRLSLLMGAMLVVSGPTVIIPLLRFIRPRGRVGSVLKWEGIFNDPIGAVLAVLVFEVILVGGARQQFGLSVLEGIATTALVGVGVGLAAAALMAWMLRRYWVERHLEIPMTIAVVIAAYAVSNVLQTESGLLATTVMGVALANQTWAPVRHIVEFGESIGVLLTSSLFVVLAADLELEAFEALGWEAVAFVAVLVLVARPLATWLSTIGSDLDWRERAVVGWMAPRGVVAASVVSVFAARLADEGIAGAELMIPYVFVVIAATAAVYGLTARPLARRLGLADVDPQGIVILGAHSWAREIAKVLSDEGVRVLLVPTNRHDAAAASLDGLEIHRGSILEESSLERLNLTGIKAMLAMTHNEEFNVLAALRFTEVFGRSDVYQLPRDRDPGADTEITSELRGRLLFGDDVTFHVLDERFAEGGAVVKRTGLTEEFGFADFCAQWEGEVIPLFLLRDGQLVIVTGDGETPTAGDTVVSVAPGEAPEDRARKRRDRDAAAVGASS